jgi:soluble lytic murein transglycosylase-like protein
LLNFSIVCKKVSGSLVLALGALAFSASAHAALYRFVDANGVMNYTNVPNDHRYKLVNTARGTAVPITDTFHPYAQSDRARFDNEIKVAANMSNVDPALIHAVISTESGYNPFARSNKGALGLMQLTSGTASRYGVTNRADPLQNILAGALYLHDLLAMFHNDVRLALAAYNAGENSVIRYGNRVPPFPETAAYVPRVLQYYKMYRTAS